jgi:hypothetical protein
MYNKTKALTQVLNFQLFCLESYRSEKGMTGLNALKDFKQTGVFDYLADGYDVLHSQSKSFLMAELTEYINHRYAAFSRRH